MNNQNTPISHMNQTVADLTSLVQKGKEDICPNYHICGMRELFLRDCTKPAYEDCETYRYWEENPILGVGAIVLPGNNLILEVAVNSSKVKK